MVVHFVSRYRRKESVKAFYFGVVLTLFVIVLYCLPIVYVHNFVKRGL